MGIWDYFTKFEDGDNTPLRYLERLFNFIIQIRFGAVINFDWLRTVDIAQYLTKYK